MGMEVPPIMPAEISVDHSAEIPAEALAPEMPADIIAPEGVESVLGSPDPDSFEEASSDGSMS
jgi:hypothetical protein